MKFGMRRPSLKRRISARTSWKRYARQNLGVKAPRGMGWLTNSKKAAYNRVYNRATFGIGDILKPRRRKARSSTVVNLLVALVIIYVLAKMLS